MDERKKRRRRLKKAYEVEVPNVGFVVGEMARTKTKDEAAKVFPQDKGLNVWILCLARVLRKISWVLRVFPLLTRKKLLFKSTTWEALEPFRETRVLEHMAEVLRARFSGLMGEGSPSVLEDFRKQSLETQLVFVCQEGGLGYVS